jgi:hypothetical protein
VYIAAGLALLYPNRYVSLIGLVAVGGVMILDRLYKKKVEMFTSG